MIENPLSAISEVYHLRKRKNEREEFVTISRQQTISSHAEKTEVEVKKEPEEKNRAKEAKDGETQLLMQKAEKITELDEKMEILEDLTWGLSNFCLATPKKTEVKTLDHISYMNYLTDALIKKDRKALKKLKIKISFSDSYKLLAKGVAVLLDFLAIPHELDP